MSHDAPPAPHSDIASRPAEPGCMLDRAAWAILLLSIALTALAFARRARRLSLPIDNWHPRWRRGVRT